MSYVFLVAAAVAVLFSVFAVTLRNPVHSVLSLVVVFFAMASVFALLGMDFLAAIQIIVYSGAILVLFLFVIMLLNIKTVERFGSGRRMQALLGAISAIGIGVVVVFAVSRLAPAPGADLPGAIERGTVVAIGEALLGSHLFAFEFITLILVAAIVGAAYLTRRESR